MSSGVEVSASMIILRVYLVLGLAHINAGRVATRTNAFEVRFLVRCYYFEYKCCNDVGFEFDDFRFDTRLCKLRTKSIAPSLLVPGSKFRKSKPNVR